MTQQCIQSTGPQTDAPTIQLTESNASHANTTASTSGTAPPLTANRKQSDTSAVSETTISPASLMLLNGDRRRKLSSKEFLLIKLCSKTASLGYLSKKFHVSREHVRRIIERDEGFCSKCQKWKSSGEIVLTDSGDDLDWTCDDCLQ